MPRFGEILTIRDVIENTSKGMCALRFVEIRCGIHSSGGECGFLSMDVELQMSNFLPLTATHITTEEELAMA
jgi:hypothetical protein